MAVATPTYSYVVPLGPVKMEVVYFDVSENDINNGDTFFSKLQNPLFARANRNSLGTAQTVLTISGREVTLTDSSQGGAGDDQVITIYGH